MKGEFSPIYRAGLMKAEYIQTSQLSAVSRFIAYFTTVNAGGARCGLRAEANPNQPRAASIYFFPHLCVTSARSSLYGITDMT